MLKSNLEYFTWLLLWVPIPAERRRPFCSRRTNYPHRFAAKASLTIAVSPLSPQTRQVPPLRLHIYPPPVPSRFLCHLLCERRQIFVCAFYLGQQRLFSASYIFRILNWIFIWTKQVSAAFTEASGKILNRKWGSCQVSSARLFWMHSKHEKCGARGLMEAILCGARFSVRVFNLSLLLKLNILFDIHIQI